ncbi:MAG: helix-turn-helix domain-containing protein [Chitinophagales bacterium]
MKQPPKPERNTDEDRIWLQKVRAAVLRHAGNNKLSMWDLAKLLEISKRTFERRLKKLTGKTPKQYLNEFRLQFAHQLITHKKWSNVEEISQKVGFEGRDHFSRIFKKHFGYNPSALIKLVQAKKKED